MTRHIDPDLVADIYRAMVVEGSASCAKVAEALDKMGVRTRTGKAPTRQAIHYILLRHPDGPELLSYTRKRVGKEVKA